MRILNGSLEKRRVVLQWIPAHCGINGNEMADKLAKRGAAMTQHDNPITLAEKRRSSNTASGLRRSLTTTTNLTEQSKS